MNEKQEGWKNHITWAVNFHVDNTFRFYEAKIKMFEVIVNRNDTNDVEKFEIVKKKRVVRPIDVKRFFFNQFPRGIKEIEISKTDFEKVAWDEIAQSWQAELNERFPEKA
jgi:hypothetical protein